MSLFHLRVIGKYSYGSRDVRQAWPSGSRLYFLGIQEPEEVGLGYRNLKIHPY